MAERVAYEALNPAVKMDARERYDRLMIAAFLFPLDKNIRWMPETFAKAYNDRVIRELQEQHR